MKIKQLLRQYKQTIVASVGAFFALLALLFPRYATMFNGVVVGVSLALAVQSGIDLLDKEVADSTKTGPAS